MVFLQDDMQRGIRPRQRQKRASKIARIIVMIVLDVSTRVRTVV
jgi:hypothetical protein